MYIAELSIKDNTEFEDKKNSKIIKISPSATTKMVKVEKADRENKIYINISFQRAKLGKAKLKGYRVENKLLS